MTSSLLSSLASLPPDRQAAILANLSDAEAAELVNDWPLWARPSQLAPPGDWRFWLFVAGRGAGKTRAGAEWVRAKVKEGCGRISLIAPTAADARDVMVEGESGLLSVCWAKDRTAKGEPMGRPLYEPSKRRITWENGAQAALFSAEEADRLRGPQSDAIWADELAAWGKGAEAEKQERHRRYTWDMAMFGLRLGTHPQAMVTTTPKPSKLLRQLMQDARAVVTSGSTFDNAANLAPSFLDAIRDRYEGTRLGRQELYAELLDDVPGALFTAGMFQPLDGEPALTRVVVGVDPSGASGAADETADEIGIVVAAMLRDRDEQGRSRFAILEDATCRLSPLGWARRASERYEAHRADAIVAERNFGGAMVESNIRTVAKNARVKLVTASRGKAVRAEPVAALYEQGRVYHARGLDELEGQMMHMTTTGYVGEGSPDRLDAAVWALSELMGGSAYTLDNL